MDAQLIDVCLGCYLQDHHNRPGELLLGASVDGTTTVAEVREELLQELNGLMIDSESFDYDAAEAAIRAACEPKGGDDSVLFDASLETPTEEELEMSESCQAWFLLTWDEEGDSDVA